MLRNLKDHDLKSDFTQMTTEILFFYSKYSFPNLFSYLTDQTLACMRYLLVLALRLYILFLCSKIYYTTQESILYNFRQIPVHVRLIIGICGKFTIQICILSRVSDFHHASCVHPSTSIHSFIHHLYCLTC